ncbi:MAG: hypothetical protein QM657_19130 [Lacrimispora sp.]|uniref:hypothetical protein n=1 Tax=Lacrimispora sp. TaxID=2719234 RepID=UPI0039E661F9
MKKKLLTTALCAMAVSLSACGGKTTSAETSSSEAATTIETTVSQSSGEDSILGSEVQKSLEAVGEVNVEKGIFNVELNIPADFVGEQTQEELNELCKEKGYKSITLNDNGSATYIMTKQQHKEMMKGISDNIDSALTEMVGSEDYPNYTNIKVNEDFTAFEITTKSTELDLAESFSTLAFYMFGGMYHVFNGTTVDNISVTFINADTGAEILTSNSKDMGK